MKLRTIIVDDEPIARDGLRALLSGDPDIEIVAECGNGLDAVDAIEQLKPDLVLLDVQMPELDGIGVLRSLPRESWPGIIFVTAFDRFAITAFDMNAVDYLLKPFGELRAREAIARAKTRLQSSDRGSQDQVDNALRSTAVLRQVAVRVRGASRIVQLSDVQWIEAEGDYVRLHTANESHLLRSPLAEVSRQIDPQSFVRVHRSAIVNLRHLVRTTSAGHGDLVAELANGTEVKVSRTHRAALMQAIKVQ